MKVRAASSAAFVTFALRGIPETDAWSTKETFWRQCKSAVSTVALVTVTITGQHSILPAHAQDTVQQQSLLPPPSMISSDAFSEKLKNGMKAPTEDKPQIRLPQDFKTKQKTDGPTPIVQGLLYLVKPTSEIRPQSTDTLVLTASSLTNPDQVLAGAKIPVIKLRFPTSFRMYEENILAGKLKDWLELEKEADILIQAKICPEGTRLPCSDEESTLTAKGVSKLVRNLPGLQEGDRVRAAASLPLA